ncbi:MAG: hypothetical protein KJI71_05250 [Patescibacteria group bacterium]|nr:hypothetical protein [Patescibacteria group bacterium]
MRKEIVNVNLKIILVVLCFVTLLVEVMIKHSLLIGLLWSILVIFGAVVLVMEIKGLNNKRN